MISKNSGLFILDQYSRRHRSRHGNQRSTSMGRLQIRLYGQRRNMLANARWNIGRRNTSCIQKPFFTKKDGRNTATRRHRMTTHERLSRATSFLMQLSDGIEMKLDPFERRLHKLLQDELIECVRETGREEPIKPKGAKKGGEKND